MSRHRDNNNNNKMYVRILLVKIFQSIENETPQLTAEVSYNLKYECTKKSQPVLVPSCTKELYRPKSRNLLTIALHCQVVALGRRERHILREQSPGVLLSVDLDHIVRVALHITAAVCPRVRAVLADAEEASIP